MTESDFTAVMAPKVIGTRVLHDAFEGHDLEFFVMFGSAGSVDRLPRAGQLRRRERVPRRVRVLPTRPGVAGAHHRVGPVVGRDGRRTQAGADLRAARHRTDHPAAGARILDRLINQKTPTVIAITADWGRARQIGLGRPAAADVLRTRGRSNRHCDARGRIVDARRARRNARKQIDSTWSPSQVRRIVAAIFDCAVDDVELDETLDDIGLDSMMAMEFRMRINAMFAIDLPVLEILKGVSVNSLAVRVLGELDLPRAGEVPVPSVERGRLRR